MVTQNALQEKALKYWNNLSKDGLKRDRKDLLGAMAKELNMPEELVEKMIGEWDRENLMTCLLVL